MSNSDKTFLAVLIKIAK